MVTATIRIVVAGLALTLAASGCARLPSPAPAKAVDYPVIIRLVGRTGTITISSGPSGPVYSAQAANGSALVSNATMEELRDRRPEMHHQLNTAIAEPVGVVVDR